MGREDQASARQDNSWTSAASLLLGSAAIGGLLVGVMRTVRPEGLAATLLLLALSFGLGLVSARTVQRPAWLFGALAPALMYLSMLATNDLLFWQEGRLFSDGVETFALLLGSQMLAGALGGMIGSRSMRP